MKSFLILLFACFYNEAATDEKHKYAYASGGLRVEFRGAPWHAGIYKKTTRPYQQICGGTIIAEHVVMTAAHCFSKDRCVPPASSFAVAAGKIYRPWNDPQDGAAQKTDVEEIIIPPRYQGSVANYQDDIALVIVSTWFSFDVFVKPACVSFNFDFDADQLKEGQLGKVVGWGQTGPNDPSAKVLQLVSLPSVAIEKCIDQSPVSFRSAITVDKICAGYNNGTALCHGDSGGGLVFPGLANNFPHMFVRGVASTSPPDENSCNIYTWATFTHVLRHEQFIKSVVPDVEDVCNASRNVNFRSADPGNCKCSCFCT